MKVLIIDFFNIVKRYTYAYDISKYGEGDLIDRLTFNILNKICDTVGSLNPDIVYICSDMGKNRRAIAITGGQYKANRKRNKSLTEEEKEKDYMEYLKSVMLTLPFPFLEVKDTEADMIIYCLIDYLKKLDKNIKITIASTDSDFIQLFDKNVDAHDWYKGEVNVNNYYKKYKMFKNEYFNARNYALGKSITGDSADNIKGIYGFGWGKVTKIFKVLYNYYDDKLIPTNIEMLIDMIKELIDNGEELNVDKKDVKFLEGCYEAFVINKNKIKDNQSLIDMSATETPYIYKIQNTIKRSIADKVVFDRKEFMKLLRLDRYKDGVDNLEYDRIVAKNSKSTVLFMTLTKKMNTNMSYLRTKSKGDK